MPRIAVNQALLRKVMLFAFLLATGLALGQHPTTFRSALGAGSGSGSGSGSHRIPYCPGTGKLPGCSKCPMSGHKCKEVCVGWDYCLSVIDDSGSAICTQPDDPEARNCITN
jgi:hypothetical protein